MDNMVKIQKKIGIGLVKRQNILPLKDINACLIDNSPIGSSTNAITRGDIGNPNLFIKYPIIPKRNIIFTSNNELLKE